MGTHLGTVGEDGRFKIWEEDVTLPLNSGRRFRLVFSLPSPTKVPFVSLSFKTISMSSTYVALISRDSNLSVYESHAPASLGSWSLNDSFSVCDPPARGEETSFAVSFEPDLHPCYNA